MFSRVVREPIFGERKYKAGICLLRRGRSQTLEITQHYVEAGESLGSKFKALLWTTEDWVGEKALRRETAGKVTSLNGRWLEAERTMPSPCHSLTPRLPCTGMPKRMGRGGSP